MKHDFFHSDFCRDGSYSHLSLLQYKSAVIIGTSTIQAAKILEKLVPWACTRFSNRDTFYLKFRVLQITDENCSRSNTRIF